MVGILVTGLVSPIGGYINSNYSKEGSFLSPIAKADIPVDPLNPLDPSLISAGDAGSGAGSGGGCSSSSCGCCCE